MIQEKDHSIWSSKTPLSSLSMRMFNPPSHKAIHDNHNECISSFKNNNGIQVKFYPNCLGALFMSPNENKKIHKIFKHKHWKNL
jgi:hypothetical protein